MGDDRPQGKGADKNPKASSQGELDNRMRSLNERLDRHGRKRDDGARPARSDSPGFAYAMRLSTEFVSAILVGAAIGWGIDRLAGTAPWAMVILLLLGFCAGVLNVMRAAGRIADPYAKPATGEKTDRDAANGPSHGRVRKGKRIGE